MTTFCDLLEVHHGLSAREEQEYAERHFPAAVAKSNFHLWSPARPVPARGGYLLVGVATYSRSDMRLLDLVDEALGRSLGHNLRIDVFNTLDCKAHADFDKLIPGIGKVYQTPVIGLWENGVLREKASGKGARDLAIQTVGLEPSVVERLWS